MENTNDQEQPGGDEQTTETVETANKVTAVSIHTKVAEQIQGSGEVIVNAVIDRMAQKEVDARIETVDKALVAIGKAKEELKKASKPDSKSFAAAGGAPIETFTEAAWKKKEELEKGLKKLEGLFETALATNTKDAYAKLRELVK